VPLYNKRVMYPAGRVARDHFILDRRPARERHDAWRYQNLIVEDEPAVRQTVARSATVFLTGKECAWRCVMCDLWRYTTTGDTPAGAIPAQIAAARRALAQRGEAVTQIKLYNASNFFDPRAVPDEDYRPLAMALRQLDRVVVESHPALIGDRVNRFLHELAHSRDATPVALEVAMGLETANPDALERLNKGLTVEQFAAAAEALRRFGVALRVFLLISPPFIPAADQDRWLGESVERALSCGATAIALIPTRAGNGAMEALAAEGLYRAPDLADIERSIELALMLAIHGRGLPSAFAQSASADRRSLGGGWSGSPDFARVLVDLWDIQRFSRCSHCLGDRVGRLHAMNLRQQIQPPISCAHCGHGLAA
jgi:archaeosine synthase beta-subunit